MFLPSVHMARHMDLAKYDPQVHVWCAECRVAMAHAPPQEIDEAVQAIKNIEAHPGDDHKRMLPLFGIGNVRPARC